MFKRLFKSLLEEVQNALMALGKAYIDESNKDKHNPMK